MGHQPTPGLWHAFQPGCISQRQKAHNDCSLCSQRVSPWLSVNLTNYAAVSSPYLSTHPIANTTVRSDTMATTTAPTINDIKTSYFTALQSQAESTVYSNLDITNV